MSECFADRVFTESLFCGVKNRDVLETRESLACHAACIWNNQSIHHGKSCQELYFAFLPMQEGTMVPQIVCLKFYVEII